MPVCWLPHLPRSAWCLQLHGRWHQHRGACQGEDRLPCYTRCYEYCNGVANPGLWKSKHREPNGCPSIISTFQFLSRVTPSCKFSRGNSTFVSNFALQFLTFQICNVRFVGIIVHFLNSDLQILMPNIALQILTVHKMQLRVLSVSNFDCIGVDLIGLFSISFRYSQCSLFGGRIIQYQVCFFVAEVLSDHRGQNAPRNSVAKLCVAFFGGQVTERGWKRITLL